MSRILFAACALSLLGGCGLRGDLERPAPMWGEARERYDQAAQPAEQAEDEEPNAENDPGLGSTTSSIPIPSR